MGITKGDKITDKILEDLKLYYTEDELKNKGESQLMSMWNKIKYQKMDNQKGNKPDRNFNTSVKVNFRRY